MKPFAILKRHRNTLLLAAALALGGLTAFGTRGYISREIAAERERLQPRVETERIVVAKTDLARGDVASARTMAVREVPREYVPGSAVRPEQFDGYAGARLAAPMRAGEPLLRASLEGADVTTFSSKVGNGIRALTIAVDEVNSISGMLQPGDRIDLMLSARLAAPGGVATREVTRPLMQDLHVLATGRHVRPDAGERQARPYTAITIEVTPEQAQQLVVAQRSGRLTATLRNPDDHEPVAQRTLDVYGLLGLQPAAPAEAPPPGPELIVGGRGPLRVVAGLASAAQSTATALLSAMAAGAGGGLAGPFAPPAGPGPGRIAATDAPAAAIGTSVAATEPRPAAGPRVEPDRAAAAGSGAPQDPAADSEPRQDSTAARGAGPITYR